MNSSNLLGISRPGPGELEIAGGNTYGNIAFVRRYTTIVTFTGHAFKYVDDGDIGAYVTILESGMYSIQMADDLTGNVTIAPSINADPLQSVSAAALSSIPIRAVQKATGEYVFCSGVVSLKPGDIVRPHSEGSSQNGSNTNSQYLRIIKIGNTIL